MALDVAELNKCSSTHQRTVRDSVLQGTVVHNLFVW